MHPSESNPDPPHELHQLFLALWPDEDARARLAAGARWLREQGVRGRWIDPQRFHLTLHFLGRHAMLPRDVVAGACAAAGGVRASGFELDIDRAGSFPLARIAGWLGCDPETGALPALVHALADGLHAQGLRVQDETFVPHVTVVRDAAARLEAALPEPFRWRVTEFVLVDSRIQPFAPYRIIGRWPLR
ncbi:MAG TPA: RNA 2',3'-cyclic phosphodiesterase [Dokdonella sp.]